MQNDDDGRLSEMGRRVRQKMQKADEAESLVLQELQLKGSASREFKLRYQEALIEYYRALRPARNESPVKDWWEKVVLSEQWVKERQTETKVQGDIDSSVGIEEVEVEKFHKGLNTIGKLQRMQVTETTVKSGMAGRRESTETYQKVLDAEVLLDIHTTLDDAAHKLGFGIEPRTPTETDPDPV